MCVECTHALLQLKIPPNLPRITMIDAYPVRTEVGASLALLLRERVKEIERERERQQESSLDYPSLLSDR